MTMVHDRPPAAPLTCVCVCVCVLDAWQLGMRL
jgi:hypothetical protein